MSEKDLRRLTAERTQLRRVFTLALNEIESVLDVKGTVDFDLIEEKFIKFADRAQRLTEMDRTVSDILFSIVEDEDILEKEFDETEFYRNQWLKISFEKDLLFKRRECSVTKEDDKESVSSDAGVNKVTFKMPKLQFKKFDGNLKNWVGFWAQFKKVHDDESVDLDDKFQLLLHATEEGSPARELVESFPPAGSNYYSAIEQLKNRFGRDGLLIQLYIRELLNLVLTQSNKDKNLAIRVLYDKLVTQLRALETLGVTKDTYAIMLYPLVESSLPEVVLRVWERHRVAQRESTPPKKDEDAEQLTKLLEFLRLEVEGEERMALARNTFSSTSSKSSYEQERISTAADLINVKSTEKPVEKCIFCEGRHSSERCFKAQKMNYVDVMSVLEKRGHCFNCLRRGHTKRQCKAALKCIICGARHLPIVCPDRKKPKETDKGEQIEQSLACTNVSTVLMQTIVVTLKGNSEQKVRALIDTGSQRSYVTRRMAEKLGYTPLKEERLIHALFGGATSDHVTHQCYKVRVWSLDGSYGCNFDALDSELICQAIPVTAKGPWMQELTDRQIPLLDLHEGPIDLLLGADIAGRIVTGRREILSSGLVALETVFGWTIMGKVKEDKDTQEPVKMLMSLFSTQEAVCRLWRLDVLGIEDPAQVKTREVMISTARKKFLETTERLPDGRYQVQLPWLMEHLPLPRNFELAEKRLRKTVEGLKSSGRLEPYLEVFREWLKDKIIEEVPVQDWDKGHFLPHRPVFKEEGTTRIRPVFDASACVKGQPSLNQCLEKGENLIELIPSILLRFRMKAIGIVADIKKAFLQISVHPHDRDVLRFLIIDPQGNLRIFRHTRVVFGVSCSPFLLGAVIDRHLDLAKESAAHPYSNSFVDKLRRSFYVDNCIASVADEEELHDFVEHSTAIFNDGCFDLRGWEWNSSTLPGDTRTAVVGLSWDRQRDTLSIKSNFADMEEGVRVTRRTLLSAAQRLFDPIGFCSPATLIPKLLIQKTWVTTGGWDSEVEEDIQVSFLKWHVEAPCLINLEVPRYLRGLHDEESKVSLHIFCDASQSAFAAVAFLRVESAGEVYLYLIEAKSRVSPLKKTTIPRLELLAATIGARMGHRILKELGEMQSFFWSDSSTVLAWIKREEAWGVFVWNRVNEIRALTNTDSWNHVPGVSNPADLLSRGCFPKALIESRWWEGPAWLKNHERNWPNSEEREDEEEVLRERRRTVPTGLNCSTDLSSEMFSKYFSKYSKMVRLVGWVRRFLINLRASVRNHENYLSLQELNEAENVLLKIIQRESFEGIEDRRLKRLKPQADQVGLLRVRTRIWARKDSFDFRAPVILPGNHLIVERLIFETHIRNGHLLGQGLLNVLREKYWIPRGKQAIRKVVKHCVVCRRYSARNLEAVTPWLPEARVRDARVFEVVGIDLAGPLYLRNGDKVWLTLFTCAVYRAVHLDLASSLSTEDFLLVFRRFVARRGRPRIIITDNGTNFRGACNLLNNVDWKEIGVSSLAVPIEWKFNPPTASWWGGFFERMIGMVKVLLRKRLGRACLTQEELYTMICECETIINSRPITAVSENSEDPVAITPQMFLGEINEEGVPDLEQMDTTALNNRLKYRARLKEEIKRRFRAEYLGQLLDFPKQFKNTRGPVVGEIVLVGADGKKRLDWPLAVVEELIVGQDGHCRVVKLRTAEGSIIRPIQRIFPLEVYYEGEPSGECTVVETSEEVVETHPSQENEEEDDLTLETRCGRRVRLPARYRV